METKNRNFKSDGSRAKASRFAAVLDRFLDGNDIDPHSPAALEKVRALEEKHWETARALGRINHPSDPAEKHKPISAETRKIVIEIYASRVEVQAEWEAAVADARANASQRVDHGTANPPSPIAAAPSGCSDGRSNSEAAIGEMLAPFMRRGAR